MGGRCCRRSARSVESIGVHLAATEARCARWLHLRRILHQVGQALHTLGLCGPRAVSKTWRELSKVCTRRAVWCVVDTFTARCVHSQRANTEIYTKYNKI